MTSIILSAVVLQISAFLFCLIIGMFIVPLVLERLTFYIPRLGMLVKEDAVFKRSIVVTVAEVLGWSAVVVAIYVFLYNTVPSVFPLVTTAPVAWAAWGVAFVYLLYRFSFFGRTVKRDFYYSAYMHYITPHALQAYQVFIERLDDMSNTELEQQANLGKAIPYMHRQAVQRKMGERGILDSWLSANRKISLFTLLSPGNRLGK